MYIFCESFLRYYVEHSTFFRIFAVHIQNIVMPTDNSQLQNKNRRKATPIDNNYGHLQPQAVEIEQVVLGALMIDSVAFAVVSEILHPEIFYEPRHQHIYEAIRQLHMDDVPVDFMTVTEELKRLGYIDSVGGPAYIVELSSRVISSAHIEYHAKVLAQKYLARQLISFASNVETKAFDETIDVEELMQEAEGNLFELSQKNMKKDYAPIGDVLNDAMAVLRASSERMGGLTGISTGYTRLDELTSGWQNSDLVIIAGRPAMGKTSFALSLARNIAVDQNIPIAFFSLEMSNVQLANRLMCNVFEIAGSKILNGQLDGDEWLRLDRNLDRLSKAPLFIDDTPGLSVFELRTKARRLVREKGVKIIMIDYLQLMNANGMKFGSRQEEVSTISRSLKGLAKELDIPIIALSQLNRGVEGREGHEGKRPQLSDLRESGAIEQDADMVLFVHRPEYYRIYDDGKGNDLRGMAEIIIAKHRKGATDIVVLKFLGQFTRFDNPSTQPAFAAPDDGGEIIGSTLDAGIDPNDFPVNDDYSRPAPF